MIRRIIYYIKVVVVRHYDVSICRRKRGDKVNMIPLHRLAMILVSICIAYTIVNRLGQVGHFPNEDEMADYTASALYPLVSKNIYSFMVLFVILYILIV